MIKNHMTYILQNMRMLILGDINVGIDKPHRKSFCKTYNLTNLIKQPTCYKNPDNPTCVDLILMNVLRTFIFTMKSLLCVYFI